ncbi:glycoside hydrolase family 3 C-terminal domain-containing protein [bacterium]|nr:glycoside hydrolase family 3 C-terminal domain-containing protein [bacterium]
MKSKRLPFRIFAVIFTVQILIAQASGIPDYKNPALPVEKRVNDLVSRMTLEEKIGQMMNRAPAISRLGVPSYDWWSECLHGVARAGVATVFPQAIGLAATWNTDLMFQLSDVISTEARAKHHEFLRKGEHGRNKGLTMWSPNVNIFRDPRWGRGQETYGEDPYLTSCMGVAFVKGLQGSDTRYFKLIATPKHYAVHSGPEPERHEFNAVTSARSLYDTYLPAFEACVREGGAYSIMCAYNRTLGKACCGSPPLMQKILREIWGFDGYVVSDCGAVNDIHANHHLVETRPEAAAQAVKSGTDLNCGWAYQALEEAIGLGFISEADLDKALIRLFTARMKLGMLDPPDTVPYAQIPYFKNNCTEHQALALQTSRESLVLLKNDNGFLPLPRTLDTIAVIGPNADRVSVLLGNYNGTPSNPITILEGVRKKAGDVTAVLHEKGCNLAGEFDLFQSIPEHVLSYQGKTGIQAEYFTNPDCLGKPDIKRIESEVNYHWWRRHGFPDLGSETFSIRWTGSLTPDITGKYILSVLGNRNIRLFLDDDKIIDHFTEGRPERQQVEIPLQAGKKVQIRLEYTQGSQFPFVHLAWAASDETAHKRAVRLAEKSDVVLFAGGISPDLEGEEMNVPFEGFKGGDRTRIDLPDVQQRLLKDLHQTGTPVVLIINSGSAIAVNWAQENLAAILQAWYPGQSGGAAVADVLFGDYNPAGRLPVTFYRSVDQLPPFEDYSMTGHTYRYFQGDPLYAFGYGLSYTHFKYDHFTVPEELKTGDSITLTVHVQNAGNRAGDEVVQLYVKDTDASVPVPIWSLQGFERVHLYPGQTKILAFSLLPRQLSVITDDLKRVVEPGEFILAVGGGLPGQQGETTEVITKSLILKGNPKVLETLYWEG